MECISDDVNMNLYHTFVKLTMTRTNNVWFLLLLLYKFVSTAVYVFISLKFVIVTLYRLYLFIVTC